MLPVFNEAVCFCIEKYWVQIIRNKRLDIIAKAVKEIKKKAERMIDSDTLEHKDAREIRIARQNIERWFDEPPISEAF